jgi:hypothetical protein
LDTKIPIIVLGISLITSNYLNKVDFLKNSGVMQGFWSLNNMPTDTDHIEVTENKGFQTIINLVMLQEQINEVLSKN